MRKLMLILSTCALSCQVLMADFCDPCSGWPAPQNGCTVDWPSAFNIDFGGGWRQDKFRWSIAGIDDFPNVLSQLQWKDLRIAQVNGHASYTSCRNYVVRVDADYGQIYHGKVFDADYLGDDKTGLFLLSRNKAGRGHVCDVQASAGYRVTSNCFRFIATPLIGYSYNTQHLHLYDGHHLFPADFRFPGLNSSYVTRWYGPWAGVDFEARVERCAFLFGGFEWHMVAYRAHGNWNLRPEISTFQHKAYGMGYIVTLGGKWEIWNNWSIGVVGSYRNFRTRHGHEHFVFHDAAEGDIPVRIRFNGAKWISYTCSAIISWRF